MKDLEEIPQNVKDNIEIIAVSEVTDVINHALVTQPEAVEWDEEAYFASLKNSHLSNSNEDEATFKH